MQSKAHKTKNLVGYYNIDIEERHTTFHVDLEVLWL